ncbi:MAG: DsbA family protein [Candidatus Limnocylindrales bacterium]
MQRPDKDAARRRDRRAAEREQRRPGGLAPKGSNRPGRESRAERGHGTAAAAGLAAFAQSPTRLITAGVVVIGMVALAAIFLLNQPHAATALVTPAEPAPADLGSGRTLGKADAKVTLDEYIDFQCPNCAAYARQVEPRVVNQFVVPGTAKIVLHDLAFLGPNANPATDESVQAALAANCAEAQGKFWAYQEYLFTNQGPVENGGTFSRAMLDSIATRLGLDMPQFSACMADPANTRTVQAETQAALAAGIDRTPTIIVNGNLLPSWDLRTISDAIVAAQAAPAGATSTPSTMPGTSAHPGGSPAPDGLPAASPHS